MLQCILQTKSVACRIEFRNGHQTGSKSLPEWMWCWDWIRQNHRNQNKSILVAPQLIFLALIIFKSVFTCKLRHSIWIQFFTVIIPVECRCMQSMLGKLIVFWRASFWSQWQWQRWKANVPSPNYMSEPTHRWVNIGQCKIYNVNPWCKIPGYTTQGPSVCLQVHLVWSWTRVFLASMTE